MKTLLPSVVLTTVLLAVCPSLSASVTFNFQGNDNNAPVDSLSYTSEGLTVTVVGSLLDGRPAQVQDSGWGLGVFNPHDPLGDRHFFGGYAVDGKDGPEAVTLVFSQAVRLKVLLFGSVGAYDTLKLEVDGVDVNLKSPQGTTKIQDHPASTNQVAVPNSVPAGHVFRFLAANYGTTAEEGMAYDDWKLEKIEVEPIEPVVPEPASMIIWLAFGLAGIGLTWNFRR
jgi:hypothetical protein